MTGHDTVKGSVNMNIVGYFGHLLPADVRMIVPWILLVVIQLGERFELIGFNRL